MAFFEMTLDGIPVAKARPRFRRNGSCYTEHRTASYETRVRQSAALLHKGEPTKAPVSLFLVFRMPVPTSYPKKLKETLLTTSWHHAKRPDLTNLEKAVEDAINGIVWKDDGQVSVKITRKIYSATPGVTIQVVEMLEP